MRKLTKLCGIMLILIMIVLLCGCADNRRGLYSSDIAEQHFNKYQTELENAAIYMKSNPNIWVVLKGENSHWDSTRTYTQIEDYSIYSNKPLSQTEIEEIKKSILPAFSDILLESVRRHPEGFATYVFFFYQATFYDTRYLIAKEIQRDHSGQLSDRKYYTEQKDLQNDWFVVCYE